MIFGIDISPLLLSLQVAILSTGLALVTGLALAWILARYEFAGKEVLDAAVLLPLVLPPTVLGYYLLVVVGRETWFGRAYESVVGQPLVFTWQAAVLAAWLHSAPLLVKSARAALEDVDSTYENAARVLGAGEWRVFWRISLPLAARPVGAAAAIAFARAMGDFGVTLMVAGSIPGKTRTVAVAIYEMVAAGDEGSARVLVGVVTGVCLVVLWVANRWGAR